MIPSDFIEGDSLPVKTLSNFIAEALEDAESLQWVFMAFGYTFRIPSSPEVPPPRAETRLDKAVLKDARDRLTWYETVRAAGYKKLLLKNEEIRHLLKFLE